MQPSYPPIPEERNIILEPEKDMQCFDGFLSKLQDGENEMTDLERMYYEELNYFFAIIIE